MKKPITIKVAHLTYTVRPISSKVIIYEGSNYGLCVNSPVNEIFIDPEQSPAEQNRVLVHELIHAIHWAYNIEKKARTEEEICQVLESPFAALFCDNPHLPALMAAAYAGKPIVLRE